MAREEQAARRRGTVTEAAPLPMPNAVWLKAEIEFPSFCSYRQTNASPSYAIGSPFPSPAAVKLTLVDTAIRFSGSVSEGRRIFDLVKGMEVLMQPPEKVIRVRAFIKRLKPGKQGGLEISTGVRDYFRLEGTFTLYLCMQEEAATKVEWLLYRLRRLGTSDSLCWCQKVEPIEPDKRLCLTRLDTQPLTAALLLRRIVVTLADLTSDARFEHFDPFSRGARGKALEEHAFLAPLVMESYGENWAIYRREPLP